MAIRAVCLNFLEIWAMSQDTLDQVLTEFPWVEIWPLNKGS